MPLALELLVRFNSIGPIGPPFNETGPDGIILNVEPLLMKRFIRA